MRFAKLMIWGGAVLCAGVGASTLAAGELQDLSRGVAVTMAPKPDEADSAKVERLSLALTDGQISTLKDQQIWKDSGTAIWKYQGRINLALDLGTPSRIEEVAIRLLGGTAEAGAGQGKSFPTEVEVFVSQDGEHYEKVASYSRWTPGDMEKFGVPEDKGIAWVHDLKFPGLNAYGRWVGLRVYGTGLTATDEISVRGVRGGSSEGAAAGDADSFTVRHPQPYFHKPYLEIATNVPLPVPLALMTAPGLQPERLVFRMDLPAGVELRGGTLGQQDLREAKSEALPDGGRRYRLEVTEDARNLAWNNRKHFGRFFLQASGWQDGQTGSMSYQFGDGTWESPELQIPLRAVDMPPAPRLQKIMTSLGWWYPYESTSWPDVLPSFRTIGLNTLSYTSTTRSPVRLNSRNADIALLQQAGQEGFYVSVVDMAIHGLLARHADQREIYCQFPHNEVGNTFCPSYRGPLWDEEVRRVHDLVLDLRPHFLSEDIEVWKAADRVDFDFSAKDKETRKCLRCEADFQAFLEKHPGKNATDWRRSKGLALWSDMISPLLPRLAEKDGIKLRNGGYNFRPNQTYQEVWNFNILEDAGLIDHSQISTYTCLYPRHIAWIGDRIREDRKKLKKGSVMPWLTPGDAGPFPGEAFQWMVLEAYANGADGIWFWSNRLWDSESLIAYNRAIRAIAPVEDIITDGELAGDRIGIQGPGRVSGMRFSDRMVFLAADYEGHSEGILTVNVHLEKPSRLEDLINHEEVAAFLPAGSNIIKLPLNGALARLLSITPLSE